MNGHQKSWLVRMLLELRCYSDLSRHIKEPHNYLNIIWKLRVCFIPKATCSVLSIDELSVSSLLRSVFFTAWEHDVCGMRVLGLSDSATVTKVGGCLRRVNYGWTYTCYVVWKIRTQTWHGLWHFGQTFSEYSQIQQMYYMKNVIFNNIIR